MAKISGEDGTATFNSNVIKITGWVCNVAGEVIKTTDSGDSDWDTYIFAGWKSWDGTFEGFLVTGQTDPVALIGTSATLTLEMATSRDYEGTAIIVSSNSTLAVAEAEAVKFVLTFQGTATLALTNA